MRHEEKSVSVARKVGSVPLLLVGAIVIYSLVISIISSLLLPGWPDLAFWVLHLLIICAGVGLIWGGVFLWNRWPLLLGIIQILLGLFTIPAILGLRNSFVHAEGAKAQWLGRMLGAYLVLAALLALTGIALLFIDKKRRGQIGSMK
jgi:hypothetical protein